MSDEVPQEVQTQIDELRAGMEILLEKYSQGVPWAVFVSMLGSIDGSMHRLLDRAEHVPLSARIAPKPKRRRR